MDRLGPRGALIQLDSDKGLHGAGTRGQPRISRDVARSNLQCVSPDQNSTRLLSDSQVIPAINDADLRSARVALPPGTKTFLRPSGRDGSGTSTAHLWRQIFPLTQDS